MEVSISAIVGRRIGVELSSLKLTSLTLFFIKEIKFFDCSIYKWQKIFSWIAKWSILNLLYFIYIYRRKISINNISFSEIIYDELICFSNCILSLMNSKISL